ncbi:MAG: hypothetical protein Q8Q15_03365 [bacterium]|nr:hypothetical protein [bacterium]
MSNPGEVFFTSVGCMDGRVLEPVLNFGKELFGAKYGDTITEAGLVGLLSKEDVDQALLVSIKAKITISLEKHHSKGIVIHGHEECAVNPVDDEIHKKDILKTAELIRSLFPNIEVVPVFVKREGGNWNIEKL